MPRWCADQRVTQILDSYAKRMASHGMPPEWFRDRFDGEAYVLMQWGAGEMNRRYGRIKPAHPEAECERIRREYSKV